MINQLSASQLKELLHKREISNREIVQSVINRIEEVERSVGAFLTLRTTEDLLAEADAFDQARLRGDVIGPWRGYLSQ